MVSEMLFVSHHISVPHPFLLVTSEFDLLHPEEGSFPGGETALLPQVSITRRDIHAPSWPPAKLGSPPIEQREMRSEQER